MLVVIRPTLHCLKHFEAQGILHQVHWDDFDGHRRPRPCSEWCTQHHCHSPRRRFQWKNNRADENLMIQWYWFIMRYHDLPHFTRITDFTLVSFFQNLFETPSEKQFYLNIDEHIIKLHPPLYDPPLRTNPEISTNRALIQGYFPITNKALFLSRAAMMTAWDPTHMHVGLLEITLNKGQIMNKYAKVLNRETDSANVKWNS